MGKIKRILMIDKQEWGFNIGHKVVTIYSPSGKKYFPKFTDLIEEKFVIEKNFTITPALIYNYIKYGILNNTYRKLNSQKCNCCDEIKDDVRLRCNPYTAEIHGKLVKSFLCDKCEEEIAQNI